MTFEEHMNQPGAIERMQESAKASNAMSRKLGIIGNAQQYKKDGVKANVARRLFAFVLKNPHTPVAEIASKMRIKKATLYNAVNEARRIAQTEGFDWCVEDVRDGKQVRRRIYWLEPQI